MNSFCRAGSRIPTGNGFVVSKPCNTNHPLIPQRSHGAIPTRLRQNWNLLKQTIAIAIQLKLLRQKDLSEVNVDTTVQPKAIAFPTDSRLNFKITRPLVKTSRKVGILLRQSYVRVTKRLLFQQGQYARARQMNRARRCQKKLHTILGRLTRDISPKLTQ